MRLIIRNHVAAGKFLSFLQHLRTVLQRFLGQIIRSAERRSVIQMLEMACLQNMEHIGRMRGRKYIRIVDNMDHGFSALFSRILPEISSIF